MKSAKLPNYLRTHRKRCGLSQSELAFLLGSGSRTNISRHESHTRLPSPDTLFGYEIIFQAPAHTLFAGMYSEVAARIHERARMLLKEIEGAGTPNSTYKRAFLEQVCSSLRDRVTADTGVRLVALDPTSHGFGYVVFEGPMLLDWGHAHVRPCTNKRCLEQIASLLARYTPGVVVIENWDASRRYPRVKRLLTEVVHYAKRSGADVERFSWHEVHKTFMRSGSLTKDKMAEMIAGYFPELAPRLPPPRKIWMSEDERTSIFDAAGLALTFFEAMDTS